MANEAYKQIIKTAIGSLKTIAYESYGAVDISEKLVEISRLNISVLILHRDIAKDKELNDSLKTLKVLRPHLRVIFITANTSPGDALISSLITKGIYDIFSPNSDENINLITHNLQKIIYGNKASYADVARWDVSSLNNKTEKITTIPVTTALIVNVTKCAGSTMLATSLAGAINKYKIRSAVIEMPHQPYLFDSLGLRLLENNINKFYSYPHIINSEKQPEIGKETIKENIIWLVPDSRLQAITDWSYPKMMRLLYCCKEAGALIVDGGSNLNKAYLESIIPIVDLVIAVIDPLPAQIIKAKNNINKLLGLKSSGCNIIFAVNKWSKGLSKQDFAKLINVKPHVYIPQIDQASIYKSAYACKTPYSRTEVQEILHKPMQKLVSLLLPPSVIHNVSRKNKFFNLRR